MTGDRHLFFYGNAVSDGLRADRGIVTDSPAATRKMIGLCRALRAVGVRASIVSMGRGGGTRSGRVYRGYVARIGGVPIIYGPVWDVPILSQIVSALWMGLCAARMALRDRRGVHLMYNQMSAYLLALVSLKLLRAKTFADIEDGPVAGNAPAYSRPLGTLSPRLFAYFVSGGALLATSALANGTTVRPVKTYFGAIPTKSAVAGEKEYADGPLRVLFAGYLNEDTGLTILSGAIALMQDSHDPLFENLVIETVGMGPGHEVLRSFRRDSFPRVHVLGRLDAAGYAAVLARAHIGLSLKPVGGEVAESTFPSKTIEYAENGLSLIATDIGDVRSLFGDAAVYVESNDPTELVRHLRAALLNRQSTIAIAARANRLVYDRLSYAAAGHALEQFFFVDDAA